MDPNKEVVVYVLNLLESYQKKKKQPKKQCLIFPTSANLSAYAKFDSEQSIISKNINYFVAKFQMIFVICFAFLTNYPLERSLYAKLKDKMSNSIDPDEMAHYEPSHLDLCCLQKPIIACSSERVKQKHFLYMNQGSWLLKCYNCKLELLSTNANIKFDGNFSDWQCRRWAYLEGRVNQYLGHLTCSLNHS